jgi:hypothetical protein
MRHASIKLNFLRELKEDGLISVKWCKSEDMPADLHHLTLINPSSLSSLRKLSLLQACRIRPLVDQLCA